MTSSGTSGSSESTSAQPAARLRLAHLVQSVLEGRYRIERELGYGGMAVVYLAHNLEMNRQVAIKVLRPDKGFEDGVVDRFRTEALAIAQLRHPHIIGIHSKGEDADILWFEMDFVEGGALDSLLSSGPLPPERVARFLAQAADALAYAHHQGVVHRDIKPSNLLVTGTSEHLVVTDFGIAKILGKSSLTETGVTVGTMAYMSPEQLAADKEVDGAADQYSLGVVAFQALTGALPRQGNSPSQFLAAQVQKPLQAVAELCPACPPDLGRLIERMLAYAPEDRWPDLSVVRQAAEEIALTNAAPSLDGLPRHARRLGFAARARRRRRLVTALVIICVAGGGWIVWARAARPSPPPLDVAGVTRQGPLTADSRAVVPRPPPPATTTDQGRNDTVARKAPAGSSAPLKPSPPRISVHHAETAAAPVDSQHPVVTLPPPRTDTQPVAPTTGVLSITSKLPGTFVYINRDPTVHIVPIDQFVDIKVPAGTVHIRVTSNQQG
ncbi:MAG: serine/threonine-protein kinase, partial [Gemmatimonadales bacterium]